MHVIDWSGPAFLSFYLLAVVVALGAWLAIRARQRGVVREGPPPDLDTYELAFLRGGLVAAVETAIIALHRRGTVALDPAGYRGVASAPPPGEHRFEQRLAAALDGGAATRRDLAQRLSATGEASEAALLARGLLVDASVRAGQSVIAKLALAAVFALGSVKLVVGVARERPVGLLLALLAITAVVLVKLPRLSRRTPRGDDALAHHRRRHAALLVTATHAPEQLSDDAAVLAYALAGAAVGAALLVALNGRPLAGDSSYPTSAMIAAGCGAACGSTFSCGSGGGGGDGGGGCGGCGGGD